MKMPEMPDFPERLAVLPKLVLPDVHGMGPNTMVLQQADVYSADQMRAYAMAYGQAVREECAKACEEVDRTTGECPEMARYCAAAIRAKE